MYRYPEKDYGRAVATTADGLREWQVRELQLVGLPVHVNHHMGLALFEADGTAVDGGRQQTMRGVRALGHVREMWIDETRGGLYWTATLVFRADEDQDLLAMYDAGLLRECSLRHTVKVRGMHVGCAAEPRGRICSGRTW